MLRLELVHHTYYYVTCAFFNSGLVVGPCTTQHWTSGLPVVLLPAKACKGWGSSSGCVLVWLSAN